MSRGPQARVRCTGTGRQPEHRPRPLQVVHSTRWPSRVGSDPRPVHTQQAAEPRQAVHSAARGAAWTVLRMQAPYATGVALTMAQMDPSAG